MSGILGTNASLTSDLNLLLQLVILVVLIVGYKFAKEIPARGVKRHRNVMLIAVVLNAIAILFVMVPSFLRYFSTPLADLSTVGILSTSLHHLLGIIAEVLGIAFVLNKKPTNLRPWMRLTILLWVIAVLLGISLYLQIAGII